MTYKNEDEDKRKSYMEKNFIPDVDLSFENFEEFIAERNALMKKEFKKTLLFNY